MTRFWRDGHWRSGVYGSHWVEGHWVDRTDWDRSSQPVTQSPAYISRQRLTFESFANPNAKCPECGARVAFVLCPNGGRVYFDYLGWPWPKHPCTDSAGVKHIKPSTSAVGAVEGRFRWQIYGWIPVRVERVVHEEPWYLLRLKRLEDDVLIRALVPHDPGDLRRVPATMSPWSSEGFATLSYVDDEGDSQELTVCKYSDFCLIDPRHVIMPM